MSNGLGEQREDGDGNADTDAWWHRLGSDPAALILFKLLLRSMLRASAVCKAWRAAALQASALPRHGEGRRRPWLFLHGRSNGAILRHTGRRNAFAFDPDEPSSWVSFTLPPDFVAGAGGFAFAAPSPSRLAFAPLLRGGDGVSWHHAPPLAFPRCNNPVVAAVPGSRDERLLLLVAGGGGFPGGLVEIDDRLPTELYECDANGDAADAAAAAGAWEQCAPLPDELGGAASSSSSSLSLSSALVGGRFFFVCGIHSCAVSAFDLSRRAWAPPRKLCSPPVPGLAAAFVATARRGRRLVVAGVEEGRRSLGVWEVEPDTLAARKVGEMPAEMAAAVLPPGNGGVRCVGQDGVIYVVSEEEHGGYPACACEVIGDDVDDDGEEELACRWSMLPSLPAAGRSGFRRMAAFCSPVLLHNHLPR